MLPTDDRYASVLHGLVCHLRRHGDDDAHDAEVGGEDGGGDRARVSDAAVTAGLYSMEPLASW